MPALRPCSSVTQRGFVAHPDGRCRRGGGSGIRRASSARRAASSRPNTRSRSSGCTWRAHRPGSAIHSSGEKPRIASAPGADVVPRCRRRPRRRRRGSPAAGRSGPQSRTRPGARARADLRARQKEPLRRMWTYPDTYRQTATKAERMWAGLSASLSSQLGRCRPVWICAHRALQSASALHAVRGAHERSTRPSPTSALHAAALSRRTCSNRVRSSCARGQATRADVATRPPDGCRTSPTSLPRAAPGEHRRPGARQCSR